MARRRSISTQTLDKTRGDFIEKIGLIAQRDGLSRIAGRMMGLLVWEGGAMSFGELAEKLAVSRGSISTATRILEERRLIKRVAKAGERQDFFELAENPYAKMLEKMTQGLNQAREEIDSTLEAIPEKEAAIRDRVAAYSDLYRKMSGAVSGVIKELN